VDAQNLIREKLAVLSRALDATSRDPAFVIGLASAQVRVLAEAIDRDATVFESDGAVSELRDHAAALAAACTVLVEVTG
jgi:hypothetical protein